MNFLNCKLLNTEEIKGLKANLERENLPWEDGKKTAGNHASLVKNNLQLDRKSDTSKKYSELIIKKILKDDLIKSFSLPKIIHGGMFTKSSKGMKYGRHIDNAYMSTGRADLSFTIFLSDKDTYNGGEL